MAQPIAGLAAPAAVLISSVLKQALSRTDLWAQHSAKIRRSWSLNQLSTTPPKPPLWNCYPRRRLKGYRVGVQGTNVTAIASLKFEPGTPAG